MAHAGRRQWIQAIGWLAVLGPAVACKSAGIQDAFTSRDSAGRRRTSIFPSEGTEIWLHVKMVSGRDNVALNLTMAAVPEKATEKFDRMEAYPGAGEYTLGFQLMLFTENEAGGEPAASVRGPWTVGHFEVDLLIDGEYQRTVGFDVEEAAAAESDDT